MLTDFFQSWSLFYPSYLTGWLIAILLSFLGIFVVAQNQIFISVAIAQSSVLGVAMGLWVSTLSGITGLQQDIVLSHWALLFAILAALTTTYRVAIASVRDEEMISWIFLVSSSLPTLLLSHSPHGLEEIHRLLSSSMIGATVLDIWIFSTLLLITIGLLCAYWQPLLLVTLDPIMAAATGLHVQKWKILSALWLGTVIGIAVRTTGVLYVFGYLVMPVLIAKFFCRELRSLFWIAPMIAFITSSMGFVLANYYDYPPAPMSTALLCIMLLIVQLCYHSFKQAL